MQRAVSPKAGPIFFNRSPRVERRYAGRSSPAPEVPAEKENQPFPLLAMLTPMLLGGAMFLYHEEPHLAALRRPMTPLMLIGNFLTRPAASAAEEAITTFDQPSKARAELAAEARPSRRPPRRGPVDR